MDNDCQDQQVVPHIWRLLQHQTQHAVQSQVWDMINQHPNHAARHELVKAINCLLWLCLDRLCILCLAVNLCSLYMRLVENVPALSM